MFDYFLNQNLVKSITPVQGMSSNYFLAIITPLHLIMPNSDGEKTGKEHDVPHSKWTFTVDCLGFSQE